MLRIIRLIPPKTGLLNFIFEKGENRRRVMKKEMTRE